MGSGFHLAGIISHVLELADQGEVITAVIYVNETENGFRIPEQKYRDLTFSIDVVHVNKLASVTRSRSVKTLFAFLLSRNASKTRYFSSPFGLGGIDYAWEHGPIGSFRLFEIDEGIGAYASKFSQALCDVKRRGRAGALQYFNSLRRLFQGSVLRGLSGINKRRMLFFKGNDIIANEENTYFYRKAFSLISKYDYYQELLEPLGKDTWLYIAQPAGPNSLLCLKDQVKIVSWLACNAKKRKKRFVVKKYDKDMTDWGSYNFDTISDALPTECLLSQTQPEKIFGFPSTSMLTAKAIFKIPAYDVSGLLTSSSEYNDYIRAHDGMTRVSKYILNDVGEIISL